MKTLIASLALVLSSGAASAGTLTCNGSYFWVRFSAVAKTEGSVIKGPININVTGAPGGPKNWSLSPTASSIRPGQSISFSAQAPEGGGSMQARFDGRGYRGSLNAKTQFGNFNVNVNCTLNERTFWFW